jgi:hypothetical protein
VPVALILLLLTIWAGAIIRFVSLDLSEKRLWIPVLLALAGVFGSILPLAIAPDIALVANAAIMLLFITSLETMRPNRRGAIALVNRRRW